MKTTRTTDSACPYCKAQLGAVTDPLGDETPSPGDVSVCSECGHLLVFDETLSVVACDDEATMFEQMTPYVQAVTRKLQDEFRQRAKR